MKISRNKLRDLIISEIKIDGFDFHSSLEKKIWEDEDSIKDDVRDNLLEICRDFLESLPIDVTETDVRLTGSLANYNWSKYSDIDLHIQVDFAEIDDDFDLLRAYFSSVTALWNLKHDIKIKGYEVEIYVENTGEDHISTGIYSVKDEEWIVQPVKEQSHDIDKKAVRKKAKSISDQISELSRVKDPKEVYDLSEKLKAKIRRMRQSGLQTKKAQYSTGNIAFKVLRRSGDLNRLTDIKNDAYDKIFSIKQ